MSVNSQFVVDLGDHKRLIFCKELFTTSKDRLRDASSAAASPVASPLLLAHASVPGSSASVGRVSPDVSGWPKALDSSSLRPTGRTTLFCAAGLRSMPLPATDSSPACGTGRTWYLYPKFFSDDWRQSERAQRTKWLRHS